MSLLFKDRHIPMIRDGAKTETRRESRPNVKEAGVYMAAAPSMVPEDTDRTAMYLRHEECDCYIRVLEVRRERLLDMDDDAFDREGGYTRREFKQIWRDINGEWTPRQRVWVVRFEYVGREREAELVTDGGKYVVDTGPGYLGVLSVGKTDTGHGIYICRSDMRTIGVGPGDEVGVFVEPSQVVLRPRADLNGDVEPDAIQTAHPEGGGHQLKTGTFHLMLGPRLDEQPFQDVDDVRVYKRDDPPRLVVVPREADPFLGGGSR